MYSRNQIGTSADIHVIRAIPFDPLVVFVNILHFLRSLSRCLSAFPDIYLRRRQIGRWRTESIDRCNVPLCGAAFVPAQIELSFVRNTILQIQIYQSLIGYSRSFGHILKIPDDIVPHSNRDLTLKPRRVWIPPRLHL